MNDTIHPMNPYIEKYVHLNQAELTRYVTNCLAIFYGKIIFDLQARCQPNVLHGTYREEEQCCEEAEKLPKVLSKYTNKA